MNTPRHILLIIIFLVVFYMAGYTQTDSQGTKKEGVVFKIPDDVFPIDLQKSGFKGILMLRKDAPSGLFVAYHLGRPELLADVMAQVAKPGGIAIFGGRGEENLGHLWQSARIVAKRFDAIMPAENFYHHFPADVMVESIDNDPRFKILDIIEQKGYNYYPNSDEGFFSFANGLATYLPLTRKLSDNKPLRFGDIQEYLFGDFKHKLFDSFAAMHEDHFPDPHDQTIVIAKVIK